MKNAKCNGWIQRKWRRRNVIDIYLTNLILIWIYSMHLYQLNMFNIQNTKWNEIAFFIQIFSICVNWEIHCLEISHLMHIFKWYSKHLPTTCISLACSSVWNDGASADTSQLNLPDMIGSTAFNSTWLAFDCKRCKTNIQMCPQMQTMNLMWNACVKRRANILVKTNSLIFPLIIYLFIMKLICIRMFGNITSYILYYSCLKAVMLLVCILQMHSIVRNMKYGI